MNPQPYDFRKAGRLGGELEQRVAAWLRSATALASKLGGKSLPYRVDLSFREVGIVRADRGLARLPDAAVGYRIAFQAGTLTGLLALPRPLMLALLGGVLGETASALPDDRDLTTVEDSLAEYLIQDLFLAALQATWPGENAVRLGVGPKEPHPKWTRVFPLEQDVLLCTFGLAGPFGEQEWFWLLPQQGLQAQLGREGSKPAAPPDADVRPHLEATVRELRVEVAVALGATELSLSDLAGLRPGDVIVLDQRVTEQLTALVAGQKKFRGWPGRVGARQAFQIDSLVEG